MVDWYSLRFPLLLLLSQILFAFLFGFHSRYQYSPVSNVTNFESPPRGLVEYYYPMYTDIHVMMFVGFGFLMTFLRRYSFSAVGFNFILCAFTLEWALIIRGYLWDWSVSDQSFLVDVQSLLTADFVSASILVSMGAVLGKVNAIQLILMSFIEVPIQVVNGYIGVRLFCAFDPGESMYVHTFGNVISSISIGMHVSSCSGAYFGLAVAFVLHRREVDESSDEKSRYTSDIFAMIGTIFLFCFWPSFNSGSITGVDRLYAVVNTYVSICASVVGAFLMSSFLKKGRFEMVHIQNSTLAGGVAIGTVSGSNIGLHGALVIGTLAGMMSVLSFHFILPRLKLIHIHDTCGVHNLHGLPGIMSGITGIIVASIGDRSGYLKHLTDVCLSGGKSRNSSTQSAYQAAALGLTIGMALVGGLIAGIMMKMPFFSQKGQYFDDESNWHLPDQINEEKSHPVTKSTLPKLL